jgi:hypothetical protein
MQVYRERWQTVAGAERVPLFGFPHGVGLEPVSVDVERMLRIFRQATRDLREVWQRALQPSDLAAVVALPEAEPFRFPDPLWVRVVYGFAVAYARKTLPRDQLLRSLVPLYLERRGGGRAPHPRARGGVRRPEAPPAGAVGQSLRRPPCGTRCSPR